VTTVTGTPGASGYVEGCVGAARFNLPHGIALWKREGMCEYNRYFQVCLISDFVARMCVFLLVRACVFVVWVDVL